ncbi:MAG: pesticidal protein Cry7Aa, partial [Ignavibacteria bacterium]
MINVKKEGVILSKTELSFENTAVLNPAVFQEGNSVHLFYRAVDEENNSTIGYCKLDGPLTIKKRLKTPLLKSESDFESRGLEDPRIVRIDDLYYLTYTAFDGASAIGALATSGDIEHFDKQGLLVPKIKKSVFKNYIDANGKLTQKYITMNDGDGFVMNKDVVFFPRRIKGKLCFMHRIRPEIQIVSVNDLNEL